MNFGFHLHDHPIRISICMIVEVLRKVASMRKRFLFKFIRSPDSAFPPDRSPSRGSARSFESSALPFPFPPQESDAQSSATSNDISYPLSIEQVFPPAASSESNSSSSRESASSSAAAGQNGSHFEPKALPSPLSDKCEWEIHPSELDFSNSTVIGKGSFGEVFKADWHGTPVAIKRIPPNLTDNELVIQGFRREVELLVNIRHPNIVQFLGASTERKPLMLINEYLRGGDLRDYLREKGALSPSKAVDFALDIARGMAYLHNKSNVVHRDLKPRNILLLNASAERLKVGDFGLRKLIKVHNCHEVYRMTAENGSYRYMAPEVITRDAYHKKVDVFSFAMILYEMLEGKTPFMNCEPYNAAKHVAGLIPTFSSKGYTSELRDLTARCWNADMNERPSFLDIVERLEMIKELLSRGNRWSFFPS